VWQKFPGFDELVGWVWVGDALVIFTSTKTITDAIVSIYHT